MRVLTLAEEWIRLGGDALLVSHDLPPKLADRCRQLGVSYQALDVESGSGADWRATAEVAGEVNPLWLVVDGYHLHRLISNSDREAFPLVLAFDDFSIGRMINADLILDQNAGTDRTLYDNYSSRATLLLGGRYCLIRGEFQCAREASHRKVGQVRRILITLGGADPSNASTDCLRVISGMTDHRLEIELVVGAANPHRAEIEAVADESPHAVTLHDSVSNMAALMSRADLAVAAPGVTCWELAYMGVPMLLATLAENQRPNAEFLARTGVACSLGFHSGITRSDWLRGLESLLGDIELRRRMVESGRRLIDGQGVGRVCRHLRLPLFQLRPTVADDARKFWEWSNEPGVRAVSFSSEPIPWDTHLAWFTERLADRNCRLWVAMDKLQRPLGQIRFELNAENLATISISLATDIRGRGLGTQLIWMGCLQLFADTQIDDVEALIKPDNIASIRAFENAGFVRMGDTEVKQQPARRFLLNREQCI